MARVRRLKRNTRRVSAHSKKKRPRRRVGRKRKHPVDLSWRATGYRPESKSAQNARFNKRERQKKR